MAHRNRWFTVLNSMVDLSLAIISGETSTGPTTSCRRSSAELAEEWPSTSTQHSWAVSRLWNINGIHWDVVEFYGGLMGFYGGLMGFNGT